MTIYVDAHACPVVSESKPEKNDMPIQHKYHQKGPKKRAPEDDARFSDSLERLITSLTEKDSPQREV